VLPGGFDGFYGSYRQTDLFQRNDLRTLSLSISPSFYRKANFLGNTTTDRLVRFTDFVRMRFGPALHVYMLVPVSRATPNLKIRLSCLRPAEGFNLLSTLHVCLSTAVYYRPLTRPNANASM